MSSPQMSSVRRIAGLPLLLLGLSCQGIVGGPGGSGKDSPFAPSGSHGANGSGGGASIDRTGSFSGPIVSGPSPASRFVRLNHRQWESTVRDALKLASAPGLSSSFVAEPLRSTFDTNGAILSVSADLFKDYQAAAEALAATIAHDPDLFGALVPEEPADDDRARAEAFVRGIGLRIYRRPLTETEVTRYLGLFDQGDALIGSGDAFVDGVELVLGFLFQSPHFVYRTELSSQVVSGRIALSDYEIATRLSYALTGTMPDDTLLSAAGESALHTREQVLDAAERLLGSPDARTTVADFHDQLIGMREFEQISKNVQSFPAFGEGVGADLKEEALSFVHNVVFEQRLGFAELFSAPYTFANARIREIYGLPAGSNDGSAFLRVELDPSQRAGLLTQAGFLSAHGEGTTPNIIMRGVNIAKKILCVDLPAPPDDVPPLPPIPAGGTNRQRVEGLTTPAPCNACHLTMINPLGYALEKLDGVGRFRSDENGQPVDATGSYELDGARVEFDGPAELARAISESQQAHDCYARHWVEYLYGHEVDMNSDAERNLVEQAGWLSKSDGSVEDLILNLLATEAFISRLP